MFHVKREHCQMPVVGWGSAGVLPQARRHVAPFALTIAALSTTAWELVGPAQSTQAMSAHSPPDTAHDGPEWTKDGTSVRHTLV